jgi:DNA-binding CsgD family transcriptional regulator/PAS domain-containing protein
MTMTISHDGAPESETPDPFAAFVGSSDVALAAVDLPSGRFLAANVALAGALGSTVDALTGTSSLDWLSPDDRRAARLGFQALADGELTGYQAMRQLNTPEDPDRVLSVWVSAVTVDGARVGLLSLSPSAGHDNQFRTLTSTSEVSEPGSVVLGTMDGSWRVDRISQDVRPLLGCRPEKCSGQPALWVIHPSDMPAFLAAVEHSRRGERAVRLMLRVSATSHGWTEVSVVLATMSPGDSPALAFALVRYDADAESPWAGSRETQLEIHMLRIADELHAAGLIPRLQQLPVLADEPRLGDLTSREWAVLARLLEGQRVSAIAGDLYVSQRTVRGNLSSIYAKLGVHSQVELIRLIRHPGKGSRSAGQ